MLSQHSNGHAYYRCRYASAYARANNIEHAGNVYLREDRLAQPLTVCRLGLLNRKVIR
jgi:hypothetical protein